MVCEKCYLEVEPGTAVCPRCGNNLGTAQNGSNQPAKKKMNKALKAILITIGSIVGLLVIGFVILLISAGSAEDPYVKGIDIEKSELYTGDDQVLSVSYFNDSSWSADYQFDVKLDGEIVHSELYSFDENETINETFTTTGLEVGTHYYEVGDKRVEFEVIPYNEFEVGISEFTGLAIAGVESGVDIYVENTGDFDGVLDVKIVVDDDVTLDEPVSIAANERIDNTVYFTPQGRDEVHISVNEKEITIPVYQTTEIEHGTRMMENTVKGYGYIMINNEIDRDMVVYLAETSDPTKAVAVRYVKSGEKHKVNSIPHGEYLLIFRVGNGWISELERFAVDEELYKVYSVIDIDNNVKGDYGGVYTYYDLEINDDFFYDYCQEQDSTPEIVE